MKPEDQLKPILSKVAEIHDVDVKELEMIYDVLIRSMNRATTIEGGLKKVLIHGFCSFDIQGHVWHKMAIALKGKQNKGISAPSSKEFWKLFNRQQQIRKFKKELDKRRVKRMKNELGEWIKTKI